MKKIGSKFLSFLLAAIMLIGLMPVGIIAPMKAEAADPVCAIGSTQYDSLGEAVDAAVEGDTITLIADITESDAFYIYGKTITIDGNGWELTFANSVAIDDASDVTFKGIDTLYGYVYVANSSNVIVKGNISAVTDGLGVADHSTAEVYGDITSSNSTGAGAYNGSTVIVHGNINAPNSNGLYANGGSTIEVDGDITSSGGFYISGSKVTVSGSISADTYGVIADVEGSSGSIVKVDGDITSGSGTGVDANGSTVTVGGSVSSNSLGVSAKGGSEVTVDGTITAPTYIKTDSQTFTVTDFTNPTTKDSYLTYTDGLNTVWITDNLDYVCEIVETGIKYTTVDAAIADVPDGLGTPTTIRLLKDIDEGYLYVSNKDIIVDMDGHNLNFSDYYYNDSCNLLYTGGDLYVSNYYLNNGANVTVDGNLINGGINEVDSTLTVKGNAEFDYTYFLNSTVTVDGNITLTGSNYLYISDAVALTVGGDFIANNSMGVYSCGDSTIVIDGNIISAYGALTSYDGDTITVGGNIENKSGYGISASAYSTGITITVGGDVTSESGIGVCVWSGNGSSAEITIDGTMTAPTYIQINGNDYTIDQFTSPTTKDGYLTYTAAGSSVWVGDPDAYVWQNVGTGVKYATLQAAANAVPDGLGTTTTLQLLKDATEVGDVTISNKDINIDLNAKDFEMQDNLLIGDNGPGSKVTVTGGDALVANGIKVSNSSDATFNMSLQTENGVSNNVSIVNSGVYVTNGSKMTVYGDITASDGTALAADNSTTVNVTGDITSSGSAFGAYDGVEIYYGANVTIIGDITANGTGFGVNIGAGGRLTLTGDISAQDRGLNADGGGAIVSMQGNITSENTYGIMANNFASVDITGDVSGKGSCINIQNGASLNMIGNIISDDGYGLWAYGDSTVDITGNIQSSDSGIYAQSGAVISVSGNVTSTQNNGAYVQSAAVNIGGDVNAAQIGVKSYVNCDVTIDGQINAGNYIVLNGEGMDTEYTITDFTAPSIKNGYLQYDDTTNFVWVGNGLKSSEPTVDEIVVGDTKLTGTGEPDAAITVTFPGGTEVTTTVGTDGTWSVDVPTGTNLTKDDKLIAVQTESGKNPSDEASATVGAKPTAPSGNNGNGGGTNPAPTVNTIPSQNQSASWQPSQKIQQTLETVDHIEYVSGYPNGTFEPDSNITRAEVAEIFFRLLKDSNKNTIVQNTFTDVPNGDWYAQAVSYLSKTGILTGYKDGTFEPDQSITRAEFAAIAARFDNLANDNNDPFTDVRNDSWAYNYIISAYDKGWITGYSDGTFKPDGDITRSEVVTMVNRMLGRRTLAANIPVEYDKEFSDITPSYWAFANIIEASVDHDYTRDASGYETWK